MRKRSALLLGLLLAGCSQQPKYVQPALPTAPNIPPTPGRLRRARARPRSTGAASFDDPRLQALIERPSSNNRDLRTAVLRIEEARGSIASSAPTACRRSTRPTGAVPLARRNQDFLGGANTQNRFDVGASVASFELDFWGRVRSLTESARANYLSTVHAQRSFQIGLVADVAEAYLTERELDARIDLAKRTVESRTARARDRQAAARSRRHVRSRLSSDRGPAHPGANPARRSPAAARADPQHALEFLVGGPVPCAACRRRSRSQLRG
jgi:multidrug efflux system outer membrane protein